MKYASIFEKISCLFKVMSSNIIYPIFLGLSLAFVILLVTKRVQSKKIKILFLLNYVVLFVVDIATNFKALSKVFDSIMTNLFQNIYFPSAYTYFFVFSFITVVTLVSLFNKKGFKEYKKINVICLAIIWFLFALVMEVVANDDIDIFKKESLFTNTSVVILLEISVGVFIIWLILLAIAYITNKIMERIEQTTDDLPVYSDVDTKDNVPTLEVELKDENETYGEYSKQDEFPSVVNPAISSMKEQNFNYDSYIERLIDQRRERGLQQVINNDSIHDGNVFDDNAIKVEEEKKVDELLDKLLNNGLPIIQEPIVEEVTTAKKDKEEIQEAKSNMEEKVISKVERENLIKEESSKDSYTLNDYKIFNKILREIRQVNNTNIIHIDKALEIKLITKYSFQEYILFKKMLEVYSK